MKCPNCQKSFKKGIKCPHCDVDTVLYMATIRLSDKLYNRGLARLTANDIFHGKQDLSKSISINKNNVPARNLLGLALFETGHVGEALKHWVISQSMLKEENPAAGYIESANKNARQLEGLNDAIGMYNRALEHIKQKSDDLAIIQLKKAVDINPKFVDALNLLTLCYLIQNNREQALFTSERVLTLDAYNPIALNYYSIINPGKRKPFRPVTKPKAPQPQGPYKSLGFEEKKQRNFHFAELFTFLIGVAVTVAACYFLLIPAHTQQRESDRREFEQTLEAARATHREELDDADEFAAGLERAIGELHIEREDALAALALEQRVNAVNHAYFLYLEGELREAVRLLDGFDLTELHHDIVDRVYSILESAYPQLAHEYYTAGLSAFSAPRDSYAALVQLENAHRFMDNEDNRWNMLLFMLGTLYYTDEAGRLDEAYEVLSELYERDNYSPPPATRINAQQRIQMNNMLASIEASR